MSWIREVNKIKLTWERKCFKRHEFKELCEMAGIGPLAERGAFRWVSTASLPMNWGNISIGKLAGVLSQLPVGRGDPWTGEPEIQKDTLPLEGFVLLIILTVIAVFFSFGECVISEARRRHKRSQLNLRCTRGHRPRSCT